eukprot:1051836-Alexandrium_andersonii.AAC.1
MSAACRRPRPAAHPTDTSGHNDASDRLNESISGFNATASLDRPKGDRRLRRECMQDLPGLDG